MPKGDDAKRVCSSKIWLLNSASLRISPSIGNENKVKGSVDVGKVDLVGEEEAEDKDEEEELSEALDEVFWRVSIWRIATLIRFDGLP